LVKAGYISHFGLGNYAILPLARKFLQNIQIFLQVELERVGSLEIKLQYFANPQGRVS